MKDITAVILAGGKSERMGEDKGLMLIDGKPMVQHLINLFDELEMHSIIIANNDQYNQFGKAVFRDIRQDKGPLGGLHSAFMNSNSRSLFVASCDTPFITTELVNVLIKNYEDKVSIPKYNGKTHPLIGIYPRSIFETIESQLNHGNYKIMDLINSLEITPIDVTENFDANIFRNLNTKNDIQTDVKVSFYGLIAERVNQSEVTISIPNTSNIDLRNHFNTKWPFLNEISYKIAIDQELRSELNKNEHPKEIAILPPFAGG